MADPDVFELMEDTETEDGRSRTAARVYSCAYADRYGSWVPKPFITQYEPGDTRTCVRVTRKGVGVGSDPITDRYKRCRIEVKYARGACPGDVPVEDFEPCSELMTLGGYRTFLSTGTTIDIPMAEEVHFEKYIYSRTIDYNSYLHYQIRKCEGSINSRYCNKAEGYAPGTMLMEAARIKKYQNPDTLIYLMDLQLSFKLLPDGRGLTWNHIYNADLPGWDDSLDIPIHRYRDFDFFSHV